MTMPDLTDLSPDLEVEEVERLGGRWHNSVSGIQVFQNGFLCPQRIGTKPNGFWWAIGSAWKDFVVEKRPLRKRVGRHDYPKRRKAPSFRAGI